MSQPPRFVPSAPKSRTGLWIGLILGGIGVCCVLPIIALVGGGFYAFNNGKGVAECVVNLTILQKTVKQYANDHDGKLPNAEKWQDQLRPYVAKRLQRNSEKSMPFKMLTADGEWGCQATGSSSTGIAFNSDFDGKKVQEVKDAMAAIVLFEIEKPRANAHEKYAPRDFKLSPKIFGTNRGWMVMPLAGEPEATDARGRVRPFGANMSSGSGSADSPLDEPEAPVVKPPKKVL